MNNDLPTIVWNNQDLGLIIDEAEQYLIEANDTKQLCVYQRDGKLIRIGKVSIVDVEGKKMTSLRFIPLVADNLVEIFTEIIQWKEHRTTAKGEVKERGIGCPDRVARTYLARNDWNVPTVRAIINAPTLRADGSILDQPGFDQATGLFYSPLGISFEIPPTPTKQDARMMLDCILDMVSEVPFVDDEPTDDPDAGRVSRAVFLSGVLSALIRPSLPAVPLHAFDAPGAGSGKSMLVDFVSYLMSGQPASPVTQGNEEETAKILSASLQAGMPLISFDNCEAPLGGAMISQAVSQPILSVRKLGKSEMQSITNTATFFATGNNLVIFGDLTRRSLHSKIDAKCERPENRNFTTKRPDMRARDMRAELVSAALTVLRAFVVAGKPQQSDPCGTFETWSATVRDCLIWLGEADPWLSVEAIRATDPTLQNNAAALHAWFQAFGSTKQLTKNVVDAASQRDQMDFRKYDNADLNDALQTVTGNDLTSRRLGEWLASMKDRPTGGFIATKAGKLHGNQQWQVTSTTSTSAGDTEQPEPEKTSSSTNDEIIQALKRQRQDLRV